MKKSKNKNGAVLSIYADSKNSDLLIRVVDNESLKVIKVISENDLLDIKDEINEMVDKLIIPP